MYCVEGSMIEGDKFEFGKMFMNLQKYFYIILIILTFIIDISEAMQMHFTMKQKTKTQMNRLMSEIFQDNYAYLLHK